MLRSVRRKCHRKHIDRECPLRAAPAQAKAPYEDAIFLNATRKLGRQISNSQKGVECVYSKMAGDMETSDEQQRRLIITDMVLENFKSYAGEQLVGPFHKVSFPCPLLCFIAIPFNRQIQAIARPV